MTIQQALIMLAGRTDKFAVRPEGEVLSLTRNLAIKNLGNGTINGWRATFGAIVADNWEVWDAEKVQQMMMARMGQGAAAPAAES